MQIKIAVHHQLTDTQTVHEQQAPGQLFSQIYMLTKTSYGVMSFVPSLLPSNSLHTPSLLCGGMGIKAEKSLILCKGCSAINKISVPSTNPKHNPIVAVIKKINSIPSKTAQFKGFTCKVTQGKTHQGNKPLDFG